jgi:hypothetical protein
MSKSHPSATPAEPAPQAVPIRSIEGATEQQVGQSFSSLRTCRCGDAQDALGRCGNEHCARHGKADPVSSARWLAEHWPAYWIVPESWPKEYAVALTAMRELR